MLFFHPMDFLIIIAFLLSLWAQFRVKGTFNRWSEVKSAGGLTGYEAARRMLDRQGLHDVPIEPVPGRLIRPLRSDSPGRALIRARILRELHLGAFRRLPRSRTRDSAPAVVSDADASPPDVPAR